MIKINRPSTPPESLNKSPDKFVEGDYSKSDVKKALLKMQYRKCCYCEKGELESGKPEIEHYIPRTHYSFKDSSNKSLWHLANKWQNLLYSCWQCNSAKSNKPPFNKRTGVREIIDPSCPDIDPEEHIDFIINGAIVDYIPKQDDSLGKTTIQSLKLETSKRDDLRRPLRRLLTDIEKLFWDLVYVIEINDSTAITRKANEIAGLMSADMPFASFSRRFIEMRLKELNESDLPQLEEKNGVKYGRVAIPIPKGSKTVP